MLYVLGFISGLAGGLGSRFMNRKNARGTLLGLITLQHILDKAQQLKATVDLHGVPESSVLGCQNRVLELCPRAMPVAGAPGRPLFHARPVSRVFLGEAQQPEDLALGRLVCLCRAQSRGPRKCPVRVQAVAHEISAKSYCGAETLMTWVECAVP